MRAKNHGYFVAGVAAVAVVLMATPATGVIAPGDSSVDNVTAGLEQALQALPPSQILEDSAALTQSFSGFSLDAALTCIQVQDLFYCPLDAWSDEPRVHVHRNDVGGRVQSSGDVTWDQYIAEIRALPVANQVELLREDLEGAISSAGKVLADAAVLEGALMDPQLVEGLPGAAEYLADFSDPPGATPMINPNFTHRLMTSTSASKQERSYYCGPASLAFMSYHDPKVKNDISHKQSDWATWIGTTTAGSNISAMKNQINKRLTGYSANVGGYSVFGIASWSEGTWQARFANTTYTKQAPILLHPKLTSTNSSYISSSKWNTGGHFNVGVGYKTESSGSHAWIFEPYAGDGSISKFVWETMKNVRQQNLDNSSWRNIAY